MESKCIWSSSYDSTEVCSRSMTSTIVGAFTIFVLFWGQIRALHQSHYAASRKRPWFAIPLTQTSWGKHLLPLLDPYMAFTLSRQTSVLASRMEGSLIGHGAEKMTNEDQLHTTQRIYIHHREGEEMSNVETSNNSNDELEEMSNVESSNNSNDEPTIWSYDQRTVRLLIGAQVHLSIPQASLNEGAALPDYTCIKLEGDSQLTNEELSDNPPLEIYPPMLLNGTAAGTDVTSRSTISINEAGKQALLELGFVPPYNCLCQMNHKSGWEIAITAFNALGYFFATISRIVVGTQTNSDWTVAPLESIACYISLLIVFQSLSEYFFGTSCSPLFKQGLFIHLTPDQLEKVLSKVTNWSNSATSAPTTQLDNSSQFMERRRRRQILFLRVKYMLANYFHLLLFIGCFVILAANYLVSYAILSYWPNICKGCPWPMIFLVLINFAILVVVAILVRLVKDDKWFSVIGNTWCVIATFITVASWGTATYHTIRYWQKLGFCEVTQDHWVNIIPHVG